VVNGWSFLVARGRREGYRSLLVPEFLAQSNEIGVISQSAGDAPVDGTPRISRAGYHAGELTLAYRTQRLTAADLQDNLHRPDGSPPVDQFGRPLDLLYGFVCRDAAVSQVDEADLDVARTEALQTYRRFLAAESGFIPETSTPFPLTSITIPVTPEPTTAREPTTALEPTAGGRPPAPPSALQPTADPRAASAAVAASSDDWRVVPRRRSRWPAVLAAAVAVVSAAIWIVVVSRGESGEVTKVEFSKLKSVTVDCTKPLPIEATVQTDDEATVTYHWKTSDGTESSADPLDFSEAAEQQVSTKVNLQGLSGDELELTQTLVIDKPNPLTASHDYILTCR
jgi:hypothetical protein